MDGDNMFRKIPTPPSSPSSHELSFSSARIESAIVFQPTSPSSTHRLSPTAQPTPSPRCRRPASCTSWSTAPSFFGIRRSTPLQPRPTRPALCLARPWPCCSAALAAAPPMLFHHPLAPTANVPEEWRATDPARACSPPSPLSPPSPPSPVPVVCPIAAAARCPARPASPGRQGPCGGRPATDRPPPEAPENERTLRHAAREPDGRLPHLMQELQGSGCTDAVGQMCGSTGSSVRPINRMDVCGVLFDALSTSWSTFGWD